MAESAGAERPLVVGLPEPLDRTMRLGPFPSVRHALKFASYAAVAVVAAAWAGPAWSLPFLGGGFVLSAYRSDGQGLDEQAVHRLGLVWRSHRPARRRRGDPATRGPYLTTVPGRLVAVVSTGGVPVAFLPPGDARILFDQFRQTLNHLDSGAFLQASTEPLRLDPIPESDRRPLAGSAEATALNGYSEMLGLLTRRRRRRRVDVALWTDVGTGGAAPRLDRAVDRLCDDLRQMGLVPERLRDHALSKIAGGIGWGEVPRP